MHELSTSIDIDAGPESAWSVLTDFAAYPDWNPFVRRIEGALAVGAQLSITLQPPGGKKMEFSPKVTRVVDGRAFSWRGNLLTSWIFTGEHQFDLEPRDGGTRLVQAETFGGLLVPLMKSMLEGSTRAGFEAMNEAFKSRCESLRASSPSSV